MTWHGVGTVGRLQFAKIESCTGATDDRRDTEDDSV